MHIYNHHTCWQQVLGNFFYILYWYIYIALLEILDLYVEYIAYKYFIYEYVWNHEFYVDQAFVFRIQCYVEVLHHNRIVNYFVHAYFVCTQNQCFIFTMHDYVFAWHTWFYVEDFVLEILDIVLTMLYSTYMQNLQLYTMCPYVDHFMSLIMLTMLYHVTHVYFHNWFNMRRWGVGVGVGGCTKAAEFMFSMLYHYLKYFILCLSTCNMYFICPSYVSDVA